MPHDAAPDPRDARIQAPSRHSQRGGGLVKPAKGDQRKTVTLHSPPQREARLYTIEVGSDEDADYLLQTLKRLPSARIVTAGNADGGANA